jgi:hypothetical protein
MCSTQHPSSFYEVLRSCQQVAATRIFALGVWVFITNCFDCRMGKA